MSPRLLLVPALALASALPAFAVDFTADIEPIFHTRCYACHGPQMQMSGFRLDDPAAALKGGYSGPVILPGDAAASKLIARVSSRKDGFRMPPAGAPLSAPEVAKLEAWINSGARFPENTPAPKLSQQQRSEHWAFQAVERPAPPPVQLANWPRNPIDRFILAKLESEGVKPSAEADKITLARRAYFDLIGLPPSPEQVDAFLSDSHPDAYERLVDKLLASDHYGERWAMPWLDAARFADSDGYEKDLPRPHAGRWRQWVIESVNRDQPFDQFTIEQIAGDLLPNPTLEQLVATGFLRNGIKNREAGVKGGEKRFEETLDRSTTIGTVWLGLTIGCAQCHDHKFDPISQRELYQFFAFFNNTVELDIEAPLPGELGAFLRAYPGYRAERRKILDQAGVPKLLAQWRLNVIDAMDHPGVNTDWDFAATGWRASMNRADWLMRSPDDHLSEIERDRRVDYFLGNSGPDLAKDEELKKKLDEVDEKLDALEADRLPIRTQAYTVIERETAQATHIALRGDWRAEGLEVEPLMLAVLPAAPAGEDHPRLKLARWLVDAENPLTPRVTLNRWWQELFGAGLVRTANDFGTQGETPSHPELLDWLASELVENGWSRKRLLRLIVTSATYRQSSGDRAELAERDPENLWLARQNRLRLRAELVRDAALRVSGLLYPKIGGRSVYPPQPEGIAELSYSKKPWPEDMGPDRYRRGMYVFFRRTSPFPMLTTFDKPDTLTAEVQRERSNTALQALNLLNDPVFVEAAQALAVRTVREASSFGRRLERIFRLALGRPPGGEEKDRIATYFERQQSLFVADAEAAAQVASFVPPGEETARMAAWTGVARGLINLDEFVTRE